MKRGAERPWTAAVSDSTITLSHGYDPVVACDWEGRPLHVVRSGRTYRRGLGGSLLEKGYSAGKRWARVETDPVRARNIVEEAFELVETATARALAGDSQALLSGRGTPRELRERLEAWRDRRSIRTPNDLERDRRRFAQVCQVPPILPPDQYRALVIQVTTGCPWNACRFCTLYADRPYQVLSPERLLQHATDIAEYMGAGLSYRQSVFLGDASLSRLSPDAVARRVRLLSDLLEERTPRRSWTFHAFADAFTPAAWPARSLEPMLAAGLRRVHVGVESGSQAVLDACGKPQSPDKVARFARSLKEAGLGLSAIFIVGLGGKRLAEEHVNGSVGLIERMGLGPGDLVYLSPLVGAVPQTGDGFADLDLANEEAAFRTRLEPLRATREFRVARYDLREFVY